VTFTSVDFDNFKTLASFRVTLNAVNVLVGGNNAGKSTVITAFRVLAVAMRTAAARRAEQHRGPGGRVRLGWLLPEEQIPMSVENVRTNYNDEPASVTFTLSNANQLILWFSPDGGCVLFVETTGGDSGTAAAFKKNFPVVVGVVPVLGPVEHQEAWIERGTVIRNLSTHRASRNFRNFWYHFPERFDVFARMVAETWPGMEIKPPERDVSLKYFGLRMFCAEDRLDRELYWLGFGFQIWCQLLTHIVRNNDATLLILDEPETYLHPDVQRKLVGIVRRAGPAILMATHATEIIAEVEPGELLLMQRDQPAARRIAAAPEVQVVLDAIGSVQNPMLTRIARTRRVLFVESRDYKLISRFARRIGMEALADGSGVTVVPMGGFENWRRVASFGWGMEKTLGQSLLVGVILVRGSRTDKEIDEIRRSLGKDFAYLHIHDRGEFDDYLLDSAVLQRTADHEMAGRQERGSVNVLAMFEEVCDSMKQDLMDAYVAGRTAANAPGMPDAGESRDGLRKEFADAWAKPSTRKALLPGTLVLGALNRRLHADFGTTLTHAQIVARFEVDEVPRDLLTFLRELDAFRRKALPVMPKSNQDRD
jgi:energy-coupling factor transporter ATP-binding protein EcfA2